MFHIGDIEIQGPVVLSPMAGVSDSPFRRLCRRMGAGFSFTEFVSARAIVQGDPQAMRMLSFVAAERPVVIQLYGQDVETIVAAARIVAELEPDVIDLNMGCPAKHVSQKGCGAGLLREPGKAGRMIEALRAAVEVPVTAKIRLGWDDDSRNYLEVVRVLEDSGVAMISVHGRTKVQAYNGRADWDAIGEIKSRVGVPVLGNGDVKSHAQALERMREYGVDGVLVGRGALGNPWLFAGSDRARIQPDEVVRVLLGHLDDMLAHYDGTADHTGTLLGLLNFRKHARAYLQDFGLDPERRRALLTAPTPEAFRALALEFGRGGARAA